MRLFVEIGSGLVMVAALAKGADQVKRKVSVERLRAIARNSSLSRIQRRAWNYAYTQHEAPPEPCLVCAELVLKNVPHGSTIVEFGCGGGILAHELFRSGWRGKYIGIDISDVAISLAKARCPQGEWRVGDMRAPLGFEPDALIMSETIYYLPPSKAREVLENAGARLTICRIFDASAYQKHSDLLAEMGFQERKVGERGAVRYRFAADMLLAELRRAVAKAEAQP